MIGSRESLLLFRRQGTADHQIGHGASHVHATGRLVKLLLVQFSSFMVVSLSGGPSLRVLTADAIDQSVDPSLGMDRIGLRGRFHTGFVIHAHPHAL